MARKILTIITALFVMLSLLPSGVNAEEIPEETINENTDAEESIQKEAEPEGTEEARSAEGHAYAVLTGDGELVFFRSTSTYESNSEGTFTDIANNTYTGTVFSGIETFESLYGAVPWDDRRAEIKSVRAASGQTICPIDMNNWFAECENAARIDLDGFDTSNVTAMNSLFYKCTALKSLDLSNFNTSNVTGMSEMFRACENLDSLDLSSFDTSKVTTMYKMFMRCKSLKELDLSGFNTSAVTDMAQMFFNCTSLEKTDLSSFDTSAVTSTERMFANCESLKELDVSSFNTANIKDMSSMFHYCISLNKLDVSSFDTSAVENFGNMFTACTSLTELDVSGFDTSNATTLTGMFLGCKNLLSLDVSHFDTSHSGRLDNIFKGCENLETVDVSHFDTSKAEYLGGMFEGCHALKEVDLSGFDTSSSVDFYCMFKGCKSMEHLDISSFDMSKADSMLWMFNNMDALKSVKLGSKFTKWFDEAYLPEGTWTNKAIGKSLSEKELFKQYPSNAASWAGTWEKGGGTAKVTGVSLNMNNAKLAADGTLQLTAKISPDNAANKNVTWSVNNSIAKVDSNGKVTMGRSYGTAKVTVKTEDGGYTDTCTIQMLFKDVADSSKYYYNPVYWAADREITKGYSAEGTFKPQNDCTREAVVTFLWRLAGKPNPKSMNSPFTDVKDSSKYYYKAVLWAVEQGITIGYADGTFKPNDTCLREHVVTFLYRYAGKPNPGVTKNPFNDVRSSDYYYNAALWANAKGIAKGYSDGPHAGGFGPKLDCLREHVVTFLYRYNKKYPK